MEKVGMEALKLLEQLAAKLGTTTDYFWPLIVKQIIISSWVFIALFIILTGIGTVGICLYKKYKEVLCDNDMEGCVIFLAVVFTIGYLVSGGLVIESIIDLLNPEYAALNKIIHMMKP